MDALSYQSIGTGAVALIVARALYVGVKRAPEGNETMARIARYVREGAMAFLAREYKILAIYAAVVFAIWNSELTPSCMRAPPDAEMQTKGTRFS